MIKIIADASLSDLSDFFQPPFQITLFNADSNVYQQIQDHAVLLCRSTIKVDAEKLADMSIKCIATVSSGTDHITAENTQKPMDIIDAKGANACAVADYVMACLAYCQQQNYVQGLSAGVIGVGAVGSAVTLRLRALGFHVICYDPLRAAEDPQFSNCEFEALLACDLLCVHANLHDQRPYGSRHLLGERFLKQLKAGTVIINAARGNIVDESAILACPQPLYYCTDVYATEPTVNPALINYATLCTPHIAGHSIEARRRSLQWVSQKLHHYFGLSSAALPNDQGDVKHQTHRFASWQAAILSLYNPEIETRILKQATDLPKTFLDLRQAHRQRHEFHCYAWPEKDRLLEAALGLGLNLNAI
jgi:erythronate-4-phosphate dehydrogenase